MQSRKAGGTGNPLYGNGEWERVATYIMNLISGLWRDAVPNRLTEYRTTHNIWKYNVDTHYILCYSIIELSFMHSTLCRRSFVLAKYREQLFETIDLRNIERHQNLEWIFGVFFCCQKFRI